MNQKICLEDQLFKIFQQNLAERWTDSLNEFAHNHGGNSGDYLKALASAWYNDTFTTGSLQKGIKTKQDVERLLQRGIVCPDGKTRKYNIDYNANFDGVDIYSDDYYEHGDHDDTIDSRTGQKWGPYEFITFHDSHLDEGWSQKYKSSINCSHPKGFSQKAHCAGKKKHNESHEVMEMICPDCGMCESHSNMTLSEIAKGAKDSNGVTKCWPGKHAEGTKKGKNGGQVRNCVPNESQGVAEAAKHGLYYNVNKRKAAGTSRPGSSPKAPTAQAWKDAAKTAKNESIDEDDMGKHNNATTGFKALAKKAGGGEKGAKIAGAQFQKMKKAGQLEQQGVAEDWNKVNHHDNTNGLSQKAVNAYRHEHPGSKLKTAVTTKPSKLKAGSKAANRRKSFCARMGGNKGPMKKPNGKPTPKALALRRWHCESVEEMQELIRLAEQHLDTLFEKSSIAYPFAGKAVGQKAGKAGQLKGKDAGTLGGKQPAQGKLVGGG